MISNTVCGPSYCTVSPGCAKINYGIYYLSTCRCGPRTAVERPPLGIVGIGTLCRRNRMPSCMNGPPNHHHRLPLHLLFLAFSDVSISFSLDWSLFHSQQFVFLGASDAFFCPERKQTWNMSSAEVTASCRITRPASGVTENDKRTYLAVKLKTWGKICISTQKDSKFKPKVVKGWMNFHNKMLNVCASCKDSHIFAGNQSSSFIRAFIDKFKMLNS